MQKYYNCLSLFDGISCARLALERAGIKVGKYYASEIDKNAIKVSKHNWPDVVHLGGVAKISVKSLSLSEGGSIFGVNGVDDTNLQNLIPEWEVLYWLNEEFSISATVRTQEPNERHEIQSPALQRFEEIRFSKCGVGGIIKTRNIERCRASRNSSDSGEYSELQCGEWWYVYRSDPRNQKENISSSDGKKSFAGNERETSAVCDTTVPISGVQTKSFRENKGVNERPRLESEIRTGSEEDRQEEDVYKKEGYGREEKSNPLSDFEREICRRNENVRINENNRVFSSVHKETQVTVVKSENGIEIFCGSFQIFCGGSPCQSFSFCGKRNGMSTVDKQEVLTLEHYLQLKSEGYKFDGQSYLFWEYVRLLREVKPKYFLLENVRMTKKWQNVISQTLGVEPLIINSSKLSAQNRVRLFWTNIPNITQPEDKGIMLKDIIQQDYDGIWVWPRGENKGGVQGYKGKSPTVATSSSEHNFLIYNGAAQRTRYKEDGGSKQVIEVRKDGKANAMLTGTIKSLLSVKDSESERVRKFTPQEAEALQTVPQNYTSCISDHQRYRCLGNGWTVDVIAHILSFLPDEYKNLTAPEIQVS